MRFPPTFILSLDCEGKWGMADCLKPFHHQAITSANLTKAYRQLLDTLDRHGISATFAFVMAFALSESERTRFQVLDEEANPDDRWLRHYWDCLKAGLGDGWHQPEAFDMVRSSGLHEIASHGFCHRPLADAAIDPPGARCELRLATEAAKLKQIELRTLVFPRNEVGNLEAVRATGYQGYRARLDRRRGRAAALLEEYNVWRAPQSVTDVTDGLVVIPSGRFFNWRFGPRKLVPPAVTVARWRHQLETCARHGGVVHLWLHPHNLITGPGTASVLDKVLAHVASLRQQGGIRVMTQVDYCREMLARPAREIAA